MHVAHCDSATNNITSACATSLACLRYRYNSPKKRLIRGVALRLLWFCRSRRVARPGPFPFPYRTVRMARHGLAGTAQADVPFCCSSTARQTTRCWGVTSIAASGCVFVLCGLLLCGFSAPLVGGVRMTRCSFSWWFVVIARSLVRAGWWDGGGRGVAALCVRVVRVGARNARAICSSSSNNNNNNNNSSPPLPRVSDLRGLRAHGRWTWLASTRACSL
jgi:hypothetical protein